MQPPPPPCSSTLQGLNSHSNLSPGPVTLAGREVLLTPPALRLFTTNVATNYGATFAPNFNFNCSFVYEPSTTAAVESVRRDSGSYRVDEVAFAVITSVSALSPTEALKSFGYFERDSYYCSNSFHSSQLPKTETWNFH